jgi:cobalamin-independent methionine synthase catalytic subunit
LYEEVAGVAKLPLVLHACGDTTRLFRFLTRNKVNVLSLDFYHYPRLLEEAAKGSYDQKIGLGALDAHSPRIEAVEEVKGVIERARKALGEERISFVHPHCGQRSLDREVAYAKNANLTLARDDVYFGDAEEARPHRLRKKEYDTRGYFLISVKGESQEIVATFYTYEHRVVKRYKSRQAEKILQSINGEAERLGISRRHLAYITLELGRAEESLQSPHLIYRQRLVE